MKRESDGDPIKYLHEQMALMKEKMQKIEAEGKRPVLASAFISPDTERPDRETQVFDRQLRQAFFYLHILFLKQMMVNP
ncbi:hypothetical protein PGTUg99_009127 [Puccinia graminis f. sp. tritici]|uniref:Uncharacterized protein n=1 Tax=Puccinia graminis f. sp. tritici TaxID=56615 RepID=A0A5B0NCA4_PUCGR|nr:hypothetical protein PGTUg99_009127 [Puccinia graminis f. sp. tritici]